MSKKDHTRRNSSLEFLHPAMRTRVIIVLDELHKLGIPIEAFETYRSPERQARLFKKRPRVTRARPWRSYHQYGCSVDFVPKPDGRWSWSQRGERKKWWSELHRIGVEAGLKALSWEKPHLQLANVTIKQLRRGEYPPGGDDPWVYNLNKTIERWEMKGRKGAPPFAEYDDFVDRPHIGGYRACGLDDDDRVEI